MRIPPDTWEGTFGQALGMAYERAEPGSASASLEVRPEHCNPPGVCHGGALFTLADDAMGAALHPLCPEGTLPTATHVGIQFSRSARPGALLRVEARVLSHGRRTAVVQARLEDGEGRLVALASGSFLFVEG